MAQENNCTNLTIIRNLKKNLGDSKYKELINKSKSNKEKSKTNKNQANNPLKINFDNEEDLKRDYEENKVLNLVWILMLWHKEIAAQAQQL